MAEPRIDLSKGSGRLWFYLVEKEAIAPSLSFNPIYKGDEKSLREGIIGVKCAF